MLDTVITLTPHTQSPSSAQALCRYWEAPCGTSEAQQETKTTCKAAKRVQPSFCPAQEVQAPAACPQQAQQASEPPAGRGSVWGNHAG